MVHTMGPSSFYPSAAAYAMQRPSSASLYDTHAPPPSSVDAPTHRPNLTVNTAAPSRPQTLHSDLSSMRLSSTSQLFAPSTAQDGSGPGMWSSPFALPSLGINPPPLTAEPHSSHQRSSAGPYFDFRRDSRLGSRSFYSHQDEYHNDDSMPNRQAAMVAEQQREALFSSLATKRHSSPPDAHPIERMFYESAPAALQMDHSEHAVKEHRNLWERSQNLAPSRHSQRLSGIPSPEPSVINDVAAMDDSSASIVMRIQISEAELKATQLRIEQRRQEVERLHLLIQQDEQAVHSIKARLDVFRAELHPSLPTSPAHTVRQFSSTLDAHHHQNGDLFHKPSPLADDQHAIKVSVAAKGVYDPNLMTPASTALPSAAASTAALKSHIEDDLPAAESQDLMQDAPAANDQESNAKLSVLPYAKLFSSAAAAANNAAETQHDAPSADLHMEHTPLAASEQPDAESVDEHDQESTSPKYLRHQEEQICRKWNRGECFKGTHCNYYHECLKCGGPHPKLKCPAIHDAAELAEDASAPHHSASAVASNSSHDDVDDGDDDDEPCIKWNYRDCNWGEKCHRSHLCLHCRSASHRAVDCPENDVSNDDRDVCMNWNNGRCRMGARCKRAHVCSVCYAHDHTSAECDLNELNASVSEDFSGYDDDEYPSEVCLNWNNGRCRMARGQCRRSHVCSLCSSPSHSAIECPDPNISPQDLVEGGVEICLNWNSGRCTEGHRMTGKVPIGNACKRLHICSVCKTVGHPASRCTWEKAQLADKTAPSVSQVEICMNWNQNRCRLGSERCKRIHACSLCRSRDHTAADCSSRSASPVAISSVTNTTNNNNRKKAVASSSKKF